MLSWTTTATTTTMDLSLLVEFIGSWATEIKLLGAMGYGHGFKIICTAWQIDKETSEPLRFPRCLFVSPEYFRTIGSWMVMGLVFMLPGETFDTLVDQDVWGFPIGYLSLFVFGFVADDLFVILPAVVTAKLREFVHTKLGKTLNGKPRKLPDDFPG